jgi:hypothetical protein
MRTRCLNPHTKSWAHYGGRGIRICDRWLASFDNFLADMGPRPARTTLDRIDVNGNYEPGNCRWATNALQARNKRNNRRVSFDGQETCLADVEKSTGVAQRLIRYRLAAGWPVADAIARRPGITRTTKITAGQAAEIKRILATPGHPKYATIGSEFGISASSVRLIDKGLRWAAINPAPSLRSDAQAVAS